jgi:diadenosine tetraphosphatase ApaH/serine/threonine PP2A family protein phosphatase
VTVREVAEELVEEVEGPEERETGVDVDYESIQIDQGGSTPWSAPRAPR